MAHTCCIPLRSPSLSSPSTPSFNLGDSTAKLARKRRKKRGIQMMSSNQRKAAGLTQIPKGDLKYTMFLPLHQLWVAYMHDILDRGNSRFVRAEDRIFLLRDDRIGGLIWFSC
jgi:hypothetical protein